MEKINQGHPLSQSPDFVKENIELLKSLFPTIVKEGKIVMEELEALLGKDVEKEDEYYNFTWAGKSMARREANKPSTATLRPDKSESKDWDTTGNIFIEGDNLEVLKLLQKSYANKIKMIYIDPPYNTGKDFVYKDKYADNLGNYLEFTGQIDESGKKSSTNTESDGRYHSNWLNMMYPRLKLARNLLTDDGVIFISIDDNEVYNLKKVCDEIFGENNFIAQITRATGTPTGGGGAKPIVNEMDFLLVYSKSPNLKFSGTPLTEEESSIYDKEDEHGVYLIRPLRRTGGEDRREDRPTMYYSLTAPDGTEIYPIAPAGYESRWICGKEKFDELNNSNLIEWKQNGNNEWVVYQKFYLEGRLKQPGNLWTKVEGNKKATRDVRDLFNGKKVFDFPKPVGFISKILEISTRDNDIILDFFAGSGSTAHAVMKLNRDERLNRKYICVQLPELCDEKTEAFKAGFKTISEICKTRIIRASEKINSDIRDEVIKLGSEVSKLKLEIPQENTKLKIEDLIKKIEQLKSLDLGFKFFKLDSSNIIAWDGNPEKLKETLFTAGKNIKEDRSEEDVLFEILLKYGLDLTVPIEEKSVNGKLVYSVGYGALFICLSDNITTEIAEAIGQWKEELGPPTSRVIFKDSGFNDVQKTNSIQILKRFGINEVNTI